MNLQGFWAVQSIGPINSLLLHFLAITGVDASAMARHGHYADQSCRVERTELQHTVHVTCIMKPPSILPCLMHGLHMHGNSGMLL